MNSKRQVYVVHGYRAKISDHWFDWLKSELENDQTAVTILAMPDSAKPHKEAWLSHLKENTVVTTATYFIAHSLGCIATLLFLNRSGYQIKGAILLSGFLRELPEILNSIHLSVKRSILRISCSRSLTDLRLQQKMIISYPLT